MQQSAFGPAGFSLGNGVGEANSFDAMGRLTGRWVCAGSTSAGCSGGTQLDASTVKWQGLRALQGSSSLNGQTSNSTYSYDDFNRLLGVTTNGSLAYGFTYDQWGNRLTETNTPSVSTDGNNHLSGFTYDAAGNMLNDGAGNTYTYDPEGNVLRIATSSGTQLFTYDALNHRVRVDSGSSFKEYDFNPFGQRVSIWSSATTPLQGQYYWGGKPVGYYTTSGMHYQHQDWLGSERVRTASNGSVEGAFSQGPFGESPIVVTGTDTDDAHFAGQDNDQASLTSHAQYRELATTYGRWTSPDPYDGSYDFTYPQSLNRYTYGLSNPLSLVDPSGLNANIEAQATCSICASLGNFLASLGDWFSSGLGDSWGGDYSYGSMGYTSSDFVGDGAVGGGIVDQQQNPITTTTQGPAPNNGKQEPPPPCQAKVLNATNNQFGTNYADANVNSTFNYSTGAGPGQGTLNLNITGSTTGVSPGYYPLHWYTYVIGYGSTLHVVSGPNANGGLDSDKSVLFGPNQGTFHIDSGFPLNPVGALFHYLLNFTKLGGYPKC